MVWRTFRLYTGGDQSCVQKCRERQELRSEVQVLALLNAALVSPGVKTKCSPDHFLCFFSKQTLKTNTRRWFCSGPPLLLALVIRYGVQGKTFAITLHYWAFTSDPCSTFVIWYRDSVPNIRYHSALVNTALVSNLESTSSKTRKRLTCDITYTPLSRWPAAKQAPNTPQNVCRNGWNI